MKLLTFRTPDGTRAGRLDGDEVVELSAPDVRSVLADQTLFAAAATATGTVHELSTVELAPVVPQPSKVVCVGSNYKLHIEEMGSATPSYPTLFAKYSGALIGAKDDLVLPPESPMVDWEAELVIVIGTRVRRARERAALDAIAGFTILNDTSMRDYQRRTTQFLQGKSWERSTPVGPVVVTVDEIGDGTNLRIGTDVDGAVMQDGRTDDLLFGPQELVEYVSTIMTLEPGDLIATGTPSGVGAGRTPQVFLQPGSLVRTWIEGIGELRNNCVAEISD